MIATSELDRLLRITNFGETIRVRPLQAEHGQQVQALLEESDDYSRTAFGLPTGEADAQSLFLSGLELVDEQSKLLLGAWEHSAGLVALVDLLAGYPDDQSLSVGLVLVSPLHRSNGIGAELIRLIELIAGDLHLETVRVHCHVKENSRAASFWRRQEYELVEEEEMLVNRSLPRTRQILERRLSRNSQ